jgi:hypothetical protein
VLGAPGEAGGGQCRVVSGSGLSCGIRGGEVAVREVVKQREPIEGYVAGVQIVDLGEVSALVAR